ncbi:MAG: RNA-binding protein [Halobacteriota archaeon]|nr:RNA-binding protein [Halobacteriota archaeon]
MRAKSRHFLRKSDAKKMIERLRASFGDCVNIFEGKKIEMVETDTEYDLILIDGEPLLFVLDKVIFPTIKGASKIKPENKKVVIDMGAIKFITNGADVMSPGITSVGNEIETGDLVVITDESHDKAIAIGKALVPGKEMIGEEGKAIKCIHYVGDKLWDFITTLQD